jgi:hypothetical protein
MNRISRRNFLRLTGAALAGYALPFARVAQTEPGWPQGSGIRLGRMTWPWRAAVLARPHPDGRLIRNLDVDEVVPILRDIVGRGMAYHTHVWNEIEDGYVYSPYLQPVKNLPQTPLTSLPPDGVWTEVSIPYVDAHAQADPEAPVVYRLYYSAVFKITEIVNTPGGAVWYRVFTEIGTRMYAPAHAFRVIHDAELTPISPDIEDKTIVVHMARQSLSAFEGQTEVYRARISSGANYFGDDGVTLLNGTPSGAHSIWQKRISRHMQGGTLEAGYDVPGVGWVCYFASNGAALHSTYWHNDFGIPKSHGCLNCRPGDAKWLFRWTKPVVSYQPGDVTVNWANRGTVVDIRMEA